LQTVGEQAGGGSAKTRKRAAERSKKRRKEAEEAARAADKKHHAKAITRNFADVVRPSGEEARKRAELLAVKKDNERLRQLEATKKLKQQEVKHNTAHHLLKILLTIGEQGTA
jgi:hypothetical protein